jgi:hypothetical protein
MKSYHHSTEVLFYWMKSCSTEVFVVEKAQVKHDVLGAVGAKKQGTSGLH